MQDLGSDQPIARSPAGLFKSHVRMLELMAAHCERLLTTNTDEDELRAAAASYRELASRLREIISRELASA